MIDNDVTMALGALWAGFDALMRSPYGFWVGVLLACGLGATTAACLGAAVTLRRVSLTERVGSAITGVVAFVLLIMLLGLRDAHRWHWN